MYGLGYLYSDYVKLEMADLKILSNVTYCASARLNVIHCRSTSLPLYAMRTMRIVTPVPCSMCSFSRSEETSFG